MSAFADKFLVYKYGVCSVSLFKAEIDVPSVEKEGAIEGVRDSFSIPRSAPSTFGALSHAHLPQGTASILILFFGLSFVEY